MNTLFGALAAAVLGCAPGVAAAGGDVLQVTHEPVRCVRALRYPVLDACVEPASRVARVRAYFRADDSAEWHSVELRPVGTCYRGALPQPLRSTRVVRYYISATDVLSGESRTPETTAQVVEDERGCRSGTLGPFLSSTAVAVGGRGLPQGFVGGPGDGGGGTKTVAVVLGGGALAGGALLVAHKGTSTPAGGSVTAGTSQPTTTTAPAATPTPTTTLPSSPPATTTTTTAPPATTTTTTTTPAASGCAVDSLPPTVSIQSPAANADVGASVAVSVKASDPGPVSSGIRQVRLFAQEVGTSRTVSIATLPGPGPAFATTWSLPSCSGAQDRWDLSAEATDGCGRTATDTVRVRRKPSTCGFDTVQLQSAAAGVAWTSELSVAGGRLQLVANGAEAATAGDRRSRVVLRPARGTNRIEAVLVQGSGAPGLWRLSVEPGLLQSGSLRALAGEVAAVEPDAIVFRLSGRPGERVVLAFELSSGRTP